MPQGRVYLYHNFSFKAKGLCSYVLHTNIQKQTFKSKLFYQNLAWYTVPYPYSRPFIASCVFGVTFSLIFVDYKPTYLQNWTGDKLLIHSQQENKPIPNCATYTSFFSLWKDIKEPLIGGQLRIELQSEAFIIRKHVSYSKKRIIYQIISKRTIQKSIEWLLHSKKSTTVISTIRKHWIIWDDKYFWVSQQ